MNRDRAYRLAASFHERPWGRTSLGPWFPVPEKRTGEVWFTAEPALPLLIKFILTDEPLSLQVHPDDEYARAHEKGSAGKTEMWYILDAEPGSSVALGFVEPVSKEQMRQAALSGEILNLVKHVAAKAGDVIFIPAGTVHALGKGISLLEIQQQSDITYRLYDYGRGRELHLDKGIEVSQRGPAGKTPQPVRLDDIRTLLASCKYFVTEEWKLTERYNPPPVPGSSHVLIFLGGAGTIDGERFQPGEAWAVPDGKGVIIEPESTVSIVSTFAPKC